MTRMITLEKEYRVEAMAWFPVSITEHFQVDSYEEAEAEFNKLCDEGKYSQYFLENKPGDPDIEIIEIDLLETNQEK